MTNQLFVGFTVAVLAAACGGSRETTTAIQPPTRTTQPTIQPPTADAFAGGRTQTPPGDSRSITPEQLTASTAANVYDAIARLRPLWLRGQGSRAYSRILTAEIVVIVDGQYFGNPTALRGIATNSVNELRYLTGPEATNQYPWLTNGRHIESAIIVYHGTRVAQ